MRRKLLKTALTLFTFTLILCGCSSDNDNSVGTITPPDEKEDYVLEGVLKEHKTLKANTTYSLVGGYEIDKGGILTIEEGVTINATRTIDGAPDYLLVKQGGKIIANGTKNNPIIMTSSKKEAGAWGGIHICGYAPINLVGGVGKSEIGDAPFGGNDPADDSGELRYIRLEYTGFAFSPTKESNGVTFYGVGNGTKVEYLQSYYGADDGFEWFGGTVNAKYLVSTASEDDSFDWTDGWVGKGQFWVAYQNQAKPDDKGTAIGDCLIEADNREDNFTNTPVSKPVLSNITLVGNNDTNKQQRGIRLRAGTNIEIYNTIVTGKPKSITLATDQTVNSFIDGKSIAEYIHSTSGFFNETDINIDLNKSAGNVITDKFNLEKGYIGVIKGGKDMSADPFFTKTDYIGAVSPDNDWTAGWTRHD